MSGINLAKVEAAKTVGRRLVGTAKAHVLRYQGVLGVEDYARPIEEEACGNRQRPVLVALEERAQQP